MSALVSTESYNITLNTMCIIMLRPGFPGYFPVVFMGERSNSVAPVSWQTACTNIFFPTPGGPASKMDFIRGLFSWSTCAPADRQTPRFLSHQPNSLFYNFLFETRGFHTQWQDCVQGYDLSHICQGRHRLDIILPQRGAEVTVVTWTQEDHQTRIYLNQRGERKLLLLP